MVTMTTTRAQDGALRPSRKGGGGRRSARVRHGEATTPPHRHSSPQSRSSEWSGPAAFRLQRHQNPLPSSFPPASRRELRSAPRAPAPFPVQSRAVRATPALTEVSVNTRLTVSPSSRATLSTVSCGNFLPGGKGMELVT